MAKREYIVIVTKQVREEHRIVASSGSEAAFLADESNRVDVKAHVTKVHASPVLAEDSALLQDRGAEAFVPSEDLDVTETNSGDQPNEQVRSIEDVKRKRPPAS